MDLLLLLAAAALLLTLTVSVLALLLCRSARRNLPPSRRALLLIAHPDDETMFFAPTLHGLKTAGSTIYTLCVSTGNSNGQGPRRKHELASALTVHGISVDNLVVLNYDRFQDGFVRWPKEELARVVLKQIRTLDVDTVVTFDSSGVSSHPNHIACFQALQYLYSKGLIPAGVQIFILESVPLWRKYAIPLDALVSSYHSTFLYVSSPLVYLRTWRAMFAHLSQLLWFRCLYMVFSRYVLINTLKRIYAQQRHPVQKKRKEDRRSRNR